MIIDINISWLMMSVCITPCDIITLRGITWKEILEKGNNETIGRLFLWQMLEAENESLQHKKGRGSSKSNFWLFVYVFGGGGGVDRCDHLLWAFNVFLNILSSPLLILCLHSVLTFAWPFRHRELYRVLKTHR